MSQYREQAVGASLREVSETAITSESEPETLWGVGVPAGAALSKHRACQSLIEGRIAQFEWYRE